MKNDLVSVLMPVFNAEKYLAEAIESIINQSYSNFELVICNDGSTDSSNTIIEKFKDNRIVYIKNEKNLGIIATRNKLLTLAQGEFIAIMDSDDISLPKRLEHQVNFLKKNPEYGICGTWARKVDDKLNTLGYIQLPIQNEYIRLNLLFQSSFVQSSVCIRKLAFDKLRYDSSFQVAEDYDLWERLCHKTKMYNLPKYLLLYRWHEYNISKSKESLMKTNLRIIIYRQLKKFAISISDDEIQLHEQIGNLIKNNDESFTMIQTDAQNWFNKLINKNAVSNIYDQDAFISFIWYRWIFFCFYNKKYKHAFLFKTTKRNLKIIYKTLSLVCIKGSSYFKH